MREDRAAAIGMADAVVIAAGVFAAFVATGNTVEIILIAGDGAPLALLLVGITKIGALGAKALDFQTLVLLELAILAAVLLGEKAVIGAHAAGLRVGGNHFIGGFVKRSAG